VKTRISKNEAAVSQLDWAIRLFLDFEAFVPAITLAGAAEDLLGGPLEGDAIFPILRGRLADEFSMSPATVSQDHLNNVRNWLKHWDKEPKTAEFELRTEALQLLVRATSNFLENALLPSEEIDRFIEWVKIQRIG
jgi:hypothetical protein